MNQTFVDIVITGFKYDNNSVRFFVKTGSREIYPDDEFCPRLGSEIIIIVYLERRRCNLVIEGTIEQTEGEKSLLGRKVSIRGTIIPDLKKGHSVETPLGLVIRL